MEELDGSSQLLFSDRTFLVKVQGASEQSTTQIPPGGWGSMACGCVEITFTRNISLTAKGSEAHKFYPWVKKIPWRRAWQPTPGFLPGESPWTEEPGGLQSMGSQRVGHD